MKLNFFSFLLTVAVFFSSKNNAFSQTTSCDSVNTVYASTYLNHGAMFNVIANSSITLDHLTANLNDGTAQYIVYFKNGSFIGFEQQPSAWTAIDTVTVFSNNTLTISNTPTIIPINLNINMVADDTIAFYLYGTPLSNIYLTSTTIPWGTSYAYDANIQVTVARSVYQSFGVPFSTPQIWNGSVSYCTQAVSIENALEQQSVQISQYENNLIVNLNDNSFSTTNMSMTLFNVLSQGVLNCKINGPTNSFDLSTIPAGAYICVLYKNNEVVEVKKISFIK